MVPSCFFFNVVSEFLDLAFHLPYTRYFLAIGRRVVKEDPKVSEALSIFPKPKALLGRVIQVATTSGSVNVS